jgi:lysyl endopeptidase
LKLLIRFMEETMKKSLLGLSLFALIPSAFSGESFFAPLDINSLHEQEVAREVKGEAPRFAIPHDMNFNSLTDKSFWSYESNRLVWRHRVHAPNAVSLNFGFTKFFLPPTARISIYANDFSSSIRDFTAEDNNVDRELWTPVIYSDDVTVELSVAPEELGEVQLTLGRIGQGFRTFSQPTKRAGACNIDVACTEGDDWRNEIDSVAVISRGGSTFCTGFMVNNTKNDRTPYFMTAHHCGITSSNAASLVTYWNFQRSSCRGPNAPRSQQFNTGSQFLSASRRSDFTLVRLNQAPRQNWNVSYAGWDRSGEDATMAVAIHHPATSEKSISFELDPTTTTMYLKDEVLADGTHVRVADWDKGTTEPGSSGSPLFNQDHRVIGQLHGGYASCSSRTADWYGRFYTSWEGEGTPNTRLRDHLDSANLNLAVTDTIR